MVAQRLRIDPANEKSHRSLMWLYLKAGRPLSAIAQYNELQRLLATVGRQELRRAAPSKSMSRARMLVPDVPQAGRSVAATPPPPAPRSKSYRFESAVANIAQSPTRSALPRYSAKLFGRESELKQLDDWLD